MGQLQMIEIKNDRKDAIKSGAWSDPGAKLYDILLDAFYCKGDIPAGAKELEKAIKEKRYIQWYDFLKEAYLEAPVNKIKNSPYGRTPYSRSECKYPHHVVKKDRMFISIPGLKAAYKRACQTGAIKNKEIREHLERHIKELGLESEFNNKLFSWTEAIDQKIEDNFNFIFETVLQQTGIDLFDHFDEAKSSDSPEKRIKANMERFKKEFKYNAYDNTIVVDGKTFFVDLNINSPTYVIGDRTFNRYTCCNYTGKYPTIVLTKDDFRGSYKSLLYTFYHEIGHAIDYNLTTAGKSMLGDDKGYVNRRAAYKSDIERSHTNDIISHQNDKEYIADRYAANKMHSPRGMRKQLGKLYARLNTPEHFHKEQKEANRLRRKEFHDKYLNTGKYNEAVKELDQLKKIYDRVKNEKDLTKIFSVFKSLGHEKDIRVSENNYKETLEWIEEIKSSDSFINERSKQKELDEAYGSIEEIRREIISNLKYDVTWAEIELDKVKQVRNNPNKDDQNTFKGIDFSHEKLNKRAERNSHSYNRDLGSRQAVLRDPKLAISNKELFGESASTKYYRVTHNRVDIYEATKKQCSADKWRKLLKTEAFTWLPKPDNYPENYMSYFTQDGMDKFNELTLPVVEGIIGDNIKVESFNKVDGIVYQDQFQVICDVDKVIKESLDWIEEFVNNDEFRESVVDNWEKAKTPAELLEWMDGIQYGWIDLSGNVQGTGDEDDEEDFYKEYRLQTPEKLAHTRVGVCWDQTELERDWFHFHYTYGYAVMYIEIENGESNPTHTFLMYQGGTNGEECHWFEHSWGIFRGDHKYKNFIDCIKDVVKKHQAFNNDTTSPISVYWLRDIPRANSTCEQFMKFAHKQPKIDLDKLNTEMKWISDYPYYVNDRGYEPPMPYDQLPDHLKNDPVHEWRAKTGIELIHKEPTLEELNRIWKNWQLMSDKQKAISDQKSMELFGMNNVNHYRLLVKEYDSLLNDDINDNEIKESSSDGMVEIMQFIQEGFGIEDSDAVDIMYEILSESKDFNEDEEDEELKEEIKKKKSEPFVPIYGIVKCYSKSKIRNDGTQKDEGELDSVKFHKYIRVLTRGDNYSHALVSFDDSLTSMYSYEDDGIEIDNILEKDSWMGTDSIYICVMFVRKSDKARMKRFVDNLVKHKDETAYASENLLKAYVGTPNKIDKRFVCSSFTGYILSCSNPKNLHRDYSRLRPEDITILPRAFYVMNVHDREDFVKHHQEIKKRVEDIYNEYKDEIEDYNNHLPKLMLKDRVNKLKTFDKLFDWFVMHMM